MAKKKTLPEKFIGLAVATPIGGAAIGLVANSPLPASLKTGTSNLIGVGLLVGAADLTEEEKKRRRFF